MKSPIAFTLKCWECNSVDDRACGDSVDHVKLQRNLIECPPMYKSPACIKYGDRGKCFSQFIFLEVRLEISKLTLVSFLFIETVANITTRLCLPGYMDPCEGTPNDLICMYCRTDGCNGETLKESRNEQTTTYEIMTSKAGLNSPMALCVVVPLALILCFNNDHWIAFWNKSNIMLFHIIFGVHNQFRSLTKVFLAQVSISEDYCIYTVCSV